MGNSDFDRLLFRYLHHQTSETETTRIEEVFDALHKRKVQFITAEGERLIYQEITQSGPVDLERLIEAMYELWTGGVTDYIFHADL